MKGLIRPHRTGNSPKAAVRRYTDSDVDRIRLITVWRSAGLSLTDIKAALVYVDAKDSTAADNLIASRLSQIRQRIIDQLAAIEHLRTTTRYGPRWPLGTTSRTFRAKTQVEPAISGPSGNRPSAVDTRSRLFAQSGMGVGMCRFFARKTEWGSQRVFWEPRRAGWDVLVATKTPACWRMMV